jgi:60 kDa SS-A/Ro ribonucleoprotein
VRGDNSVSYRQSDTLPAYIEGFERLQRAGDVNTVCALIDEFRFTHEMIPTQFKTSKQVWERLLSEMPVTATIRNLGVMTSLGLLRDGSSAARTVAARVTDAGILSRARVHPLTLLSALNVYRQGRGHRGQLRWQPSRQVIDALDSAFYRAFAIVAATGKRIMLAMDVSGSMGCGTIAGAPGITPMIGSAAMAMATARSEKDWQAVAFSSKGWTSTKAGGGRYQGWGTAISPLPISPRQRLDDVVRTMQRVDMGCTDCALPMLYAADQKIAVDAFYVFTDNETWAGKVHPHQALEQYRQKMGIGAKLVVVGMTATQFSIAHPQDAGMLDVVGFDSAAPNLMADFTRN